MYHYVEPLFQKTGLSGYFCRVIDPATNMAITMSADANGTPIQSVSGVANMAKSDDAGNFDFYVGPGTYHRDVYGPDTTTFIRRDQYIAFGADTTFNAGGTSAVTRGVPAVLSDRRSTSDKSGDLGAQANAWFTDLPNGGRVLIPGAGGTISSGVTYAGQRLALEGEVGNYTIATFTGSGVMFNFESAGLGGQYQSSLGRLGFYSPNSSDKTMVRTYNTSAQRFYDLDNATGNWLGTNSKGFDRTGRELALISDCTISCSQPYVASPNPVFGTICVDHDLIERCQFIGTSSTYPTLNLKQGVVVSSFTVRQCALVGGNGQVKGRNTTGTGGSVAGLSTNLRLSDIRCEQSLVATAFSIDLDYTGTNLNEALIDNFRTDTLAYGVRMRGVLRSTLINVAMQQGSGQTSLDVDLAANGTLHMIGCSGQTGGAKTIAHAHPVRRLRPYVTGDPIGAEELWAYFAFPAVSGGVYDYSTLPVEEIGGIPTAALRFTFPAGTSALQLPLIVGAAIDTDVIVRAANGRLEMSFKQDGTFDVRQARGVFASSATSGKIYPSATLLQANALAATTLVSIEVRQ